MDADRGRQWETIKGFPSLTCNMVEMEGQGCFLFFNLLSHTELLLPSWESVSARHSLTVGSNTQLNHRAVNTGMNVSF